MILDGAGWHRSHMLRRLRRITPRILPRYPPVLNPVERLWHWFREHHWSNRTDADEQTIIAEAIRSHRTLGRHGIPSICRTSRGVPADRV